MPIILAGALLAAVTSPCSMRTMLIPGRPSPVTERSPHVAPAERRAFLNREIHRVRRERRRSCPSISTLPPMKFCQFQRAAAAPAPVTFALLTLTPNLWPSLQIGVEHPSLAVVLRE